MKTWAGLVRSSAGASAALALGRGIAVVDRESIAIGTALAVCIALTFTKRTVGQRIGWIGAAALLVNQACWMIPATVSLTSAAPSIAGAAFPALLSVGAILGLIASVARARNLATRVAPVASATAAVLGLALTFAVPAAGAGAARVRQGDLVVFARDTKFEPAALSAHAGDIGVVFKNDDLFWHTFTVSNLDANVTVATAGKRRLVIRDVQPGTYRFVCAIPGHESAGMSGELVVK